MAKKQTRRSISVKGLTYQRLKDYCAPEKLSGSGFLETAIGEKLDTLGVPVPTVLRPRDPPPGKVKDEDENENKEPDLGPHRQTGDHESWE